VNCIRKCHPYQNDIGGTIQMGEIIMNQKEQRRNDVIVKLIAKEITVSEARRLLYLSKRQILRMKKKYLTNGMLSIKHALKIKPSKKGYPIEFAQNILDLYLNEYNGFNFHHFNDEIEDKYQIRVSDSFIRKLLLKNGINSPYTYKKHRKAQPLRARRELSGELIQVDASKHKWLYQDNNYYHLHGGIDDSTGIVTGVYLTKEETSFGYQQILMQTIKNYGIPACLYSDYRTVFQSTKRTLTLDEEISGKELKSTKFAVMLENLGCDVTSTFDPRAKGRIERLWRSFQDRLLKELAKEKIKTIEEANEYILNIFVPKYNARFAVKDFDPQNTVFISVPNTFDYNRELALFTERKIVNKSHICYKNNYFLLYDDLGNTLYTTSKTTVKIYELLDKTLEVLVDDKWYKAKKIDYKRKGRYTLEETNKNIAEFKGHPASSNHPWKNEQYFKRQEKVRQLLSKYQNPEHNSNVVIG
jgi:transposase